MAVSPLEAQVTIGSTALPNAGTVLDLNNANATVPTYKGVLLPQVALTSTIVYGLNTASSAAAVNGMLVYNKLAAGSSSTAVMVGGYIWQAGAWNIVNVGTIAGDNFGNHAATKDLNMQANGMVGTAAPSQTALMGLVLPITVALTLWTI